MNSSNTSQENEFANPGTSKLNNGSFHSIKSNNKSEYNRNLLSDYAKDQGLIGRLNGKSDNLDEVDHNNDLGPVKNNLLVNYIGRGTNQWKVNQKGSLSKNEQGDAGGRLTKSIWGNQYGDPSDPRDTQFSSTTPQMTNIPVSELKPLDITPIDTQSKETQGLLILILRKTSVVDVGFEFYEESRNLTKDEF
jgi:hypothetical protein